MCQDTLQTSPSLPGSARPAVALAGCAAFLNLYAPQALLPELAATFAASRAQASLTITATTLAVALAAPLIGTLAEAIGRKRIIVAAAWGLVAPTLAAATAASLDALLIWRFVQGLFIPAIFVATIAYIGEEWEPAEVGAVSGLYVAGTVLGGFCGRLVPGLIAEHGSWAEHAGWREGFLALGALNAVLAAAVSVWLPPARRFQRLPLHRSLLKPVQHLRNPRLLATCAVGFGLLFSQVATFTYVAFHLAQPPFSLTSSALGAIFAVFLLGVVVTPIAAQGLHRLGHRRVLAAALGLAALGLVLTLGSSLWPIAAGLSLGASGIFIGQAAAASHISAATAEARSAAVGLYLFFYYLGGSCGAAVPGLVGAGADWPRCVLLVLLAQLLTAAPGLVGWRSR